MRPQPRSPHGRQAAACPSHRNQGLLTQRYRCVMGASSRRAKAVGVSGARARTVGPFSGVGAAGDEQGSCIRSRVVTSGALRTQWAGVWMRLRSRLPGARTLARFSRTTSTSRSVAISRLAWTYPQATRAYNGLAVGIRRPARVALTVRSRTGGGERIAATREPACSGLKLRRAALPYRP